MSKRYTVSTTARIVEHLGKRWVVTDRETGNEVAYCLGRRDARETAAMYEEEFDASALESPTPHIDPNVQELALAGNEVADIDEWVSTPGDTIAVVENGKPVVIAQTRHVEIEPTVINLTEPQRKIRKQVAQTERAIEVAVSESRAKVTTRINIETGTTIRKGLATDLNLDPSLGEYVTICDDHGVTKQHETARKMRHYAVNSHIWCEQCRAIVASVLA